MHTRILATSPCGRDATRRRSVEYGAVERDPSFFPAYYNMGIAYYNSGDAKRAMELFEKTVRINPIFPDTYV